MKHHTGCDRICNCYTESFSCSFYVKSERCYSGEKIDTVTGWKFYLEQHHSDITTNEHEKLFVLQLQIHQS